MKVAWLIFTVPSCSLSTETESKQGGGREKIKHLPESLIIPALQALHCLLGFRKRASNVSIATPNRRREPVCNKTAFKEPCDQHRSEDSQYGPSSEHVVP